MESNQNYFNSIIYSNRTFSEVVTKEVATLNSTEPCTDKIYLYVGESTLNIVNKIDYPGLNFKNVYKAITWLQFRKKSYKEMPYVIFCDANISESELLDLSSFVKDYLDIYYIPLFFFAKKGNINLIRKSSRLKADDLFFEDEDFGNIKYRIESVKRIKNMGKSLIHIDDSKKKQIFTISFKRLLDITIAGVLLFILSPLFLIIAIAIKLETRGTVLYTSYRAGFHYKVFNLYKFRTMFSGADKLMNNISAKENIYKEKDTPFIKLINDSRITKVGAFLRNTSLDELPQLLNIINGDMSLVGNRPLPLYEAEKLMKDESVRRFLAPAGLTGLWQVKKRGKNDMSARERIKLDVFYAKKKSIMMDFWILSKTIPAMIQQEDV
ncbi:sugar transferase [Chondrinema litorale]|uniref:sugar transferase n=1 Tax=Chondrinema litorale TaxID=2994555 RepID=UPI002542840C|nr:sugar transferase [Chondrinema litorale]UZS00111.1 sugar transferase [Chondrinema litorale]